MSLHVLQGQPLSNQVYEQLKAAIIQGNLEPEARLTETEVAQKIGVSPTPVREAFRRLAAEGFLEIVPWKGATVRSVTDKELLETYQCREVMEGLACRLAAANIDAKGLQRFRKLLRDSRATDVATDIVQLNSEIHNLIFDYAGNMKLKAMLGLLYEKIIMDRALTAYNAKRRSEIRDEHEAVLSALEKHDGDAAEEAMRIHVRNGYAFRRKS
jgi:DNA-binding GntR family transcriptional regulator